MEKKTARFSIQKNINAIDDQTTDHWRSFGPRFKGLTAMLRAGLLLLTLVCLPTALLHAEDRRVDPSILKVMTFNAEWLWDGVEPEEGRVDFDWKGAPAQAELHMAEVAQLIIRNDPDIVNILEVEGLPALELFNENFLASSGYKPYLVKGKDTYTGQDVGLLTRIDPDAGYLERDERKGQSEDVFKSVSKHYFTTLEAGTTRIFLLGLHFISRPADESRMLPREAQADAIRSMVAELKCVECEVIVLGDFNDYDGSAESLDHIDSTPISEVLEIVKAIGTDPSDDLINAAAFLDKSDRYTSFWDKNNNDQVDFPNELTSIDHILLSRGLITRVAAVAVDHDFDPVEVSDHFPLMVTLDLSDSPVNPAVRIASLLPNPSGDERINEYVVLRNDGTHAVDLAGWTLKDRSAKTWALDEWGILLPGRELTILRNGQAMSLNNGGDTIVLLDSAGNVWHTVVYGRVAEGQIVVVDAEAPKVKMARLLPNPAGDERLYEYVVLRNDGTLAVDLSGWTLKDRSARTWALDELGILLPGSEQAILRNGQAMSLNNGGDTIALLDSAGNLLHTVVYERIAEGELVVVE